MTSYGIPELTRTLLKNRRGGGSGSGLRRSTWKGRTFWPHLKSFSSSLISYGVGVIIDYCRQDRLTEADKPETLFISVSASNFLWKAADRHLFHSTFQPPLKRNTLTQTLISAVQVLTASLLFFDVNTLILIVRAFKLLLPSRKRKNYSSQRRNLPEIKCSQSTWIKRVGTKKG